MQRLSPRCSRPRCSRLRWRAAACFPKSRTKPRAGRRTGCTTPRTKRCCRAIIRRATKLFDQLEARFPYGRYAQQAILESAFANWRAERDTAAAIAAADRFIRTYPNHPNVDYAYYLKGLVHFREDQGLIGYVYELDLVGARSEGDAQLVRGVQGAHGQVPGQPVLPGLGRAHALPQQRDGDLRGERRELLLQARRVHRRGQPRAGRARSTFRRRPPTRRRSTSCATATPSSA